MKVERPINAAIVFDEIWVRQNLTLADEWILPNCTHHFFDDTDEERTSFGPEGYKRLSAMFHRAFPWAQYRFSLDDKDSSLVRWTMFGIHRGELLGVDPSFQQVTITGIQLFRIEHGKVEETWEHLDKRGLCRRLAFLRGTEIF